MALSLPMTSRSIISLKELDEKDKHIVGSEVFDKISEEDEKSLKNLSTLQL